MKIPTIIISYNRLSFLKRQVEVLRKNHQWFDIIIIDNNSTQEGIHEYYNELESLGRAKIVRMDDNYGHLIPWTSGVVAQYGSHQAYIVTDCDIIPPDNDYMEVLWKALSDFPLYDKFALGLNLSRIPATYKYRQAVIRHETGDIPRKEINDDIFFECWTDTTFALYRGGKGLDSRILNGLRTKEPYEADHLGWHVVEPYDNETIQYYNSTQTMSTHWDVTKQTYGNKN